MQTIPFTLPFGYLDRHGNLHQQGILRYPTGKDEMWVASYPLVKQDNTYYIFAILSRLILSLGNLSEITPQMIEGFFLKDFLYLQQIYQQFIPFNREEIPLGE